MLVGAPAASDAFGKVAGECGPAADAFAKFGPKAGEVASKSAVAASALIAGALTPGVPLLRVAGAVVGGGLSRVGVAPALVEGRFKAMQAKVAGLLRDAATAGDWTTVTTAQVRAIVDDYGLPPDYSTALLCQIYTKYLLEVMRMPTVQTAEMNDLAALRGILGLDEEATGNAHYDVAVEVYRELQWTGDDVLADPESPEHRTISKLLFLSDRAFAGDGVGGSDEAYGYEVGRVRAVFDLTRESLDARCSGIAAPFYERALAGTLEKLGAVDGAMLRKAQGKLGVTDETAAGMHLRCYSDEVDSLLGAGQELTDADAARLEALADVLGLDPKDAAEATAARTVPLYVDATQKAVAAGIGADDATQKALGPELDALRTRLRLEDATAASVFKDAVAATLDAPYAAATSALKLQNTPGALASLERLMDVRRGVDAVVATAPFLTQAEGGDAFSEKLAGGGRSVPLSLYKLVFTEKYDDAGAKDELAALQATLSVTDADAALVREAVLAPKLDLKLSQTLGDGSDVSALTAWCDAVGAPASLVQQKFLRAYTDRLTSSEAIPTPEAAAKLADLQDSLGLSDEEVYPARRDHFAPLYRKSALEAMGASGGGIVAAEYAEGLEKLRERLGLAEADAKVAYHDAARARLQPLMGDVVSAFEEAVLTPEQLAKKRGTDAGEDLGRDASGGGTFGIEAAASGGAGGGAPEAVLSALAAAVDFLEGNDLARQEIDGAWSYDVDAGGMVGSVKEDLYKQCVIADLQVSDDARITDGKKERYARAVRAVPDMLALTDAECDAAKATVGTAIARKYCAAALQQKLTLDAQDQEFVAGLAARLGVTLDDVAFAAKKDALLAKLGGGPYDGPGGAERAAAFRDAAVAMGVDLAADLGLPASTTEKLFAAEAKVAIDEGDADAVGDVADGYGLDAEAASKQLGALAKREALDCVNNAKTSFIMKEPVRACGDLDQLLKYVDFADLEEGELAKAAGNKKDLLVDLYKDYCNARGPEIEARAALLKDLMG